MSALPLAGGSIPTTAAATLWTAPNYSCSASIRVVNGSSAPATFNYYLSGVERGYADPIPPGMGVDIEKGVKLPAGATFQAGESSASAGTLAWSLTGMQNDGQP